MSDARVLAELLADEGKACALLEAIEAYRLVRPGRSETEGDRNICILAEPSSG